MLFQNLIRNLSSNEHGQYWGPPSSSVDWCEVNYQYSQYVAEYFNTLSSLALVLVGLLGVWLHPWAELRYKIAFLATVVVGVGSVAFHGSLTKFSQALDEVPMLYNALAFLFITICQRFPMKPSTRNLLSVVLITHAAFTTYLVTAAEGKWQFIVFHISFGTAQLFTLYQMIRIYRRRDTDYRNESHLIFERGLGFYCLAFASWFVDMLACEYVNPFYDSAILPVNPQFHAWWHVLISMALYNMALFTLYDRMSSRINGIRPKLNYFAYVVPYIKLIRDQENSKSNYNTF